MVFLGNEGQPDDNCHNGWGVHYTTTQKTPTIAEKPYIARDINN